MLTDKKSFVENEFMPMLKASMRPGLNGRASIAWDVKDGIPMNVELMLVEKKFPPRDTHTN